MNRSSRLTWLLVLTLIACPAWSATGNKLTIQQLKDLLISLQKAQKGDQGTATELKKVDLSEQLTPATMVSLAEFVSGPQSTEQIYVLEARSAILPPPATDIPTTPAPDAAGQQAILSKASEYVAKSYSQLPQLAATRMTARFQDGIEAVQTYSGANQNLSKVSDPIWQDTSGYVRLVNTRTDPVESDNGIEKPPTTKDTTKWGPNNMTASLGPSLTLKTVLQEATASGNPKWLRWESINGKPAAAFSFNVDKKKTHFSILYCCFPNTDTAGLVNYTGAGPTSTGGGATGSNLQTISEWKPFKTSTGYHGELFLDPDSGTVLRTITQADFKPTDFVHSEAIRTDYAPMKIGDKTLVVPIRTFTLAEVVPNGDSFAAKYAVRHSFITQNYTGYHPAGASAPASK
jgi:hypothetical protein